MKFIFVSLIKNTPADAAMNSRTAVSRGRYVPLRSSLDENISVTLRHGHS